MTNFCAVSRPGTLLKATVTLGIFCLILTVCAVPSQAFAQQPQGQQAQGQQAQGQQAQASQQSKATKAELPPLPVSPIEKAEKDGTALHISLKDLTKLALQNNLDIAISDTNEELYQKRILQTYGSYDPSLSLSVGVSQSQSPNTNLSTQGTGNFSQTDMANWNLQFRQNIPTGGNFTVSHSTRRRNTNQIFDLFSPQYNSSFTAQFTQPLLRDFHTDQIRSNIKLANLDMDTNDSQFKQKVTTTVAQIQGIYWDLVAAIRNYQISREAVGLAEQSVRDNEKKVEIGTLAPIGVTESRANMANQQVSLIQAEERIFNVENQLRALLSKDRNADIWHQMIVPTDTPDFTEYKVNLQEAIDKALGNRPELEQARIDLEKNDVNYQLGRNQKKWQVNLVASFGTVGTSGPQGFREDDNGNLVPTIPENLVGGLFNANKLLFNGGFTNWNVGAELQIPLRNRSLEAQLGQLQVQRRQTIMNEKITEQNIVVEVRNAVQSLETNRQSVETAKLARELAEEQLDGETKRFQAGLSQNFQVLQRQNDLSSAQGRELQALINYKKAIITLQQSMYTLLEDNDFEIAKTNDTAVSEFK